MKYSDIKNEDKFPSESYVWRLTDRKAHEFEECDGCHAEAPLFYFDFGRGTPKHLCYICANQAHAFHKDTPAINHAANMILRQLGAFDDNEVIDYEEIQP